MDSELETVVRQGLQRLSATPTSTETALYYYFSTVAGAAATVFAITMAFAIYWAQKASALLRDQAADFLAQVRCEDTLAHKWLGSGAWDMFFERLAELGYEMNALLQPLFRPGPTDNQEAARPKATAFLLMTAARVDARLLRLGLILALVMTLGAIGFSLIAILAAPILANNMALARSIAVIAGLMLGFLLWTVYVIAVEAVPTGAALRLRGVMADFDLWYARYRTPGSRDRIQEVLLKAFPATLRRHRLGARLGSLWSKAVAAALSRSRGSR